MARSFISLCLYLVLICEIFLVPLALSLSTCPRIQLDNGSVKRRGKGKVVRFFCLRGFLLAGERYSTCIHGKWDPEPPRCVRPGCKDVNQRPGIDNLLVYPTHSGAVQHFFCKPGNILRGAEDVFCNGSKWSDNMPTCLATNEKPKLSCDFETSDLCGWTHDLNNDFDWRRENFKTPSGSIGTGPSFDHTKGLGKNGYYMYIESSSRRENDTARLISPVYNKTTENVCFKFYYHMFGATIGTLRVFLKTIDQTWDLPPNSAFFVKKGNQGDRWYRSFHNLGTIKKDFQIIIEGVRGNGYVSDIAIDDVEISDCITEDATTTMDSSTYNEIFPVIDSCENRCDQTDNETSNKYYLRCDCDQDCVDDSRCCPDFLYYCTGETSTVDVTGSYTTKGITDKAFTKWPFYGKFGTTKYITEVTKPKFTTISNRPTAKVTKPVVHLKTQPVTPVIFRKTISTTPKLTTTTTRKIEVTTTKASFTSKAITPKTSTKQPVTLGIIDELETELIDDVIAVPKPTNSDEPLYGDMSVSKENWSDELENSVDFPYTRNFSESDQLFSQVQETQPKSHFVAISIGIFVAVISISVVVFVVLKRYRFSKRRIYSSNGESQSDVRYLTSDDILDLSIANNQDELLL